MREHTRRAAFVAGLAASAVLASGCATTKPMALSKATATVSLDERQSLALATLKLANVYRTSFQPHAGVMFVKSSGEKSEKFNFKVSAPFRASEVKTDQFEELLISLALPPGAYELTGIYVTAGNILMPGNGLVPVNSAFRIAPGKAVYLGRIEAVRRERKGNEPRAGFVLPLVDQAVTGFSGGTFDVQIVDRYDQDLAIMRAEFPALGGIAVEKQLLPPPPPPPPPAPPAAPAAPAAPGGQSQQQPS